MNNRNKYFRKNLEIYFNLLVMVVGTLLIIFGINNQEEQNNFWSPFLLSSGGTLIGVGITNTITSFLNIGTLNEIKDLIDDLSYSRISSVTDNEKASLEIYSKDNQLYRYYKSWDGDNNNAVWRAKKLSFNFSEDKKRLISELRYGKKYTYEIQAAYIDQHFVFVTRENKDLDIAIVEIYAFLRARNSNCYSGLSFRQSWDPNTKRLIYPCLISSGWISELGDNAPKEQETWSSKEITQHKIIEDIWAKAFGGVDFDNFNSIINESQAQQNNNND